MGVYNDLPYQVVRFFMRRLAKGTIPYLTNSKTLTYEELTDFAKKAKILKRGEKFPSAKLEGSVIRAVTPEVIKDAIPFEADDQLNRQEGAAIYFGGKKIDNATYERDKRIASLKLTITTVQEEIATGVFLKGMYKSPATGNKVEYVNFPTGKNIAVATVKDWGVWLAKMMNAFVRAKKVRVDEILVGEDVFYAIINSYNLNKDNAISVSPTKKTTEDGDFELTINIFGIDITMIPPANDTEGKPIVTNEWVMLYNNNAYLPAFSGVKNVVKGVSSMEAVDILIRETSADEETGDSKTLAESGYCPVVTNPKLIEIYKMTGL